MASRRLKQPVLFRFVNGIRGRNEMDKKSICYFLTAPKDPNCGFCPRLQRWPNVTVLHRIPFSPSNQDDTGRIPLSKRVCKNSQ